MSDRVPVTKDGFEELKRRLRQIKEVERPNNVKDIEVARAHGDLSENAEYHAAKERQAFLDGQMKLLESKIGRAEVIDPTKLSGERVVFGATVHLEDVDNDHEVTYQIVGEDEANPSKGKISFSSPVARALIGKSISDEVLVKTPGGVREYDIVDVEFI